MASVLYIGWLQGHNCKKMNTNTQIQIHKSTNTHEYKYTNHWVCLNNKQSIWLKVKKWLGHWDTKLENRWIAIWAVWYFDKIVRNKRKSGKIRHFFPIEWESAIKVMGWVMEKTSSYNRNHFVRQLQPTLQSQCPFLNSTLFTFFKKYFWKEIFKSLNCERPFVWNQLNCRN